MSSQAVDMGTLISVCRRALMIYSFVSINRLILDYNRDCPSACRLYFIPRSALALAVEAVGNCELCYNQGGGTCRNQVVIGIMRSENYAVGMPVV